MEEKGPGFDPTGEGSAYQPTNSVTVPEAWNEESRAKILALVEERDRLLELASRKTQEAEANLVRAVLAEREAARLRAEIDRAKASQVLIPEPSPSAMAGLSAVATTERAVRATLSWARRMVHAIGADEVMVKAERIRKLEAFALETAFPEHPNGIDIDDERDHEQRASDLCRDLGLTSEALRSQKGGA